MSTENKPTENTSEHVASKAAHVLQDENASEKERSIAGSALSQANERADSTSEEVASMAGKKLQDEHAGHQEQSVAGSTLTQAEDNHADEEQEHQHGHHNDRGDS